MQVMLLLLALLWQWHSHSFGEISMSVSLVPFFSSASKYSVILCYRVYCSYTPLASYMTATPANFMVVIVLRIALLEIELLLPYILRYCPASIRSMSPFFQSPAATIGVPMYISSDLARQQVSCCKTSTSALLSLFLSRFTFFYICSLATLPYSFLSVTTLTPRYFTILVHLTPLTSSSFSLVSISDFFLFSRRFH
jgi:hypothetical protein